MINDKIFSAAKDCAKRSNMKYRLASIIYDEHNNILSSGYNFQLDQELTAKLSHRYLHTGKSKFSVHAEGLAIIRYIKKYNVAPYGLNMYVFRGNKHGEPRLAKPCGACSELITSMKMNVEYSR